MEGYRLMVAVEGLMESTEEELEEEVREVRWEVGCSAPSRVGLDFPQLPNLTGLPNTAPELEWEEATGPSDVPTECAVGGEETGL